MIKNLIELGSAINKQNVLELKNKDHCIWETFDINSYVFRDVIEFIKSDRVRSVAKESLIEEEIYEKCAKTKNCMNYTRELKSGAYLDLAINMSVIDTDQEDNTFTIIFYIEYINGNTASFTDKELIKITSKFFELYPDAIKEFNTNISMDMFSEFTRINVDAHTTILRAFHG